MLPFSLQETHGCLPHDRVFVLDLLTPLNSKPGGHYRKDVGEESHVLSKWPNLAQGVSMILRKENTVARVLMDVRR